MAIPVEMPKMSDTMEEGVVVAWLVEEGQKISAGDVIAQVETDKATMDLEVYDDGVLLKRVIEEGEAVPIGGLIAVLGQEGEDISALLDGYASGTSASGSATSVSDASGDGVPPSESDSSADQPVAAGPVSETPAPLASETSIPVSESTVVEPSGRIKSSPLARKLALDHDIDLAAVRGTGPEGRIIKRDVEALLGDAPAIPARAPAAISEPAPARRPMPVVAPGGYEAIRISQMRKAVSRRLVESKFTSPHFYLTVDLAMEKMVEARAQINEVTEAKGLPKVSFNDFVTMACALALRRHPWVNASYLEAEGEIRLHNDIHIAVAVAVDEGLITPVVRNADQKGLAQIAEETRALAARARAKELEPEEYSDSTFTTSNLGMFGIEEFTAIINPPNACILAIGAIRDVPVVKDGEVVPGKRMKVTLSCDHRVVDGAMGSEFLATVRQYLEDPLAMLL